MQAQVNQVNAHLANSGPQGPTNSIAESHAVNDQFIENIRAKLDMLENI